MNGQVKNQVNNHNSNNNNSNFKSSLSGNALLTKEKVRYKYICYDKNGKQIKGYFDAYRRMDVESFLTSQGYKIANITPTKISKVDKFLSLEKKMKYKDLNFFLTQLSTYVKSGIPLTESIVILENQTNKKSNRDLFKRINIGCLK